MENKGTIRVDYGDNMAENRVRMDNAVRLRGENGKNTGRILGLRGEHSGKHGENTGKNMMETTEN